MKPENGRQASLRHSFIENFKWLVTLKPTGKAAKDETVALAESAAKGAIYAFLLCAYAYSLQLGVSATLCLLFFMAIINPED